MLRARHAAVFHNAVVGGEIFLGEILHRITAGISIHLISSPVLRPMLYRNGYVDARPQFQSVDSLLGANAYCHPIARAVSQCLSQEPGAPRIQLGC